MTNVESMDYTHSHPSTVAIHMRCAMNQEWHVWKNYHRWLCHKYDVNYMIMQSNMTMMKRVIIKGTTESCMAIYLGMAMEMP